MQDMDSPDSAIPESAFQQLVHCLLLSKLIHMAGDHQFVTFIVVDKTFED